MTKQEMFDIAAVGLLMQGKQSRVSNITASHCLFRGPNGTKCAVGFLIPDSIYRPEMELGLSELLDSFSEVREYIPHPNLAAALMGIHDQTNPDNWFDQLLSLAFAYGLNANAIKHFASFNETIKSVTETAQSVVELLAAMPKTSKLAPIFDPYYD